MSNAPAVMWKLKSGMTTIIPWCRPMPAAVRDKC